MGFKVLTTSGAIKTGTIPTVDLASATGVLARVNGGTGSAVSLGLVNAIIATSDESIDTSDTLQNDDELLFTVVANATYIYEAMLWLTSASNTPDIKVAFTLPASATLSSHNMRLNVTATGSTELTTGSLYRATTPTTAVACGILAAGAGSYLIKGVIEVAGTAGTVQLQWAQNTSNGTATVRKAGSYLQYTRVL